MKALVSTEKTRATERVYLIGVELKSRGRWEVEDSLKELRELACTAGAEVVGSGTQKLDAPVSSTFIGPGKAEEFASLCRLDKVDTIIFDDELSPAQNKNLEGIFECKVLDRTALILDIFAQRARTREGKMQVELAQLQHILPRLTKMWSHLSRQKGGIGMRGGEGESQLEADRRRIRERMDKINLELELVQRQRTTQRRGRQRHLWPLASIVGYTNAGKSTLINALTGSQVFAEDKLFATLDPTTRRLRLPTNQNVLLSDTVGFIRKLPHQLVEAFKATLEEVVQADLLLHVVDISHPNAEAHIRSVNEVLKEIGADEKNTLMVFNKIDRIGEMDGALTTMQSAHDAIRISAKTGQGFDALMQELGARLRPVRTFLELGLPYDKPRLLARLHEIGEVVDLEYLGEKTRVRVRIPPHFESEFEPYVMARLNDS